MFYQTRWQKENLYATKNSMTNSVGCLMQTQVIMPRVRLLKEYRFSLSMKF